MNTASALTIAIVGPAHPLKGGVAVHTSELARHLHQAGHKVDLVSWSHLYPRFLYPGVATVADDDPDVEPYPATTRPLSWARPDSWVRTGRALAAYDVVVVVHVVPQVVPAHLALIAAATRGQRRPVVIALVHNVLPHEPRTGDEPLMRRFLGRVDAVLVHSPAQADPARTLGGRTVRSLPLPPHLPGGAPVPRLPYAGPARLLALGLVRPYKGIEELLRALADVPTPTLTIAGEFWGDMRERVGALAATPALRGRVSVIDGYVPAADLAPLLARHDVMALTYTSATASQMALLGHDHGLAVLASTVGSFPQDVADGVDGLLVPPGDLTALTAALDRLSDPAAVRQLLAGVARPDLDAPWVGYLAAIEELATRGPSPRGEVFSSRGPSAGSEVFSSRGPSPRGAVFSSRGPSPRGDVFSSRGPSAGGEVPSRRVPRPGRPAAALGALPALLRRARGGFTDRDLSTTSDPGPRIDLHHSDFPGWVRPTDVLAIEDDADLARATTLKLGLPASDSPLGSWAALGALRGLIALADDGHRSALVVDRSGPRSPFANWARAAGFAPVEASAELDVEAGSLDLLSQLHPADVAPDEVGDLLGHAVWALRAGGLLVVTLPLGPPEAEGALGVADLRGVLAHADNAGLKLVGDFDGDLMERIRRAARNASDPRAAYALARLTWRRR